MNRAELRRCRETIAGHPFLQHENRIPPPPTRNRRGPITAAEPPIEVTQAPSPLGKSRTVFVALSTVLQSLGAACKEDKDMGTQRWTQGRAEDVVMCSGKPGGTFQQVGHHRWRNPVGGRALRRQEQQDRGTLAAPGPTDTPCKEASQGAPQQVLCPPQTLFQFGISRAGHEQGDT